MLLFYAYPWHLLHHINVNFSGKLKLSRQTICTHILPLKSVSQSWTMCAMVIKFPRQTEMGGKGSRSLFSHCCKGQGKKGNEEGFSIFVSSVLRLSILENF